jgi:transposase InsO family protein
MMLGWRRERAPRSARLALAAGEQVVHAAEAIVGRAWAEDLLRDCDRMDRAVNAAREQYEAACLRLFAAQRCGDPGEISVAHVMVERAIDACRTGEVARERGRQALQAALDALAHSDSATGQGEGGDTVSASALAVMPGPSIRHVPPDGRALQTARSAVWRFGRLRVRRAPDPGQP